MSRGQRRWTWGVLAEEGGFTIIEILVAVLILAFVIAAGASLFAHGEDSSAAVERESQLISVADQQIETIRAEVKAEGFAELAMQGNPAALPSTIPNTSPFSSLKADPTAFATRKSTCGGSGYEYAIEANYDNTAEGAAENPDKTADDGFDWWNGCDAGTEPLVILDSVDAFVPAQQTVAVGSDTAIVDTYVTDTYVGCANTSSTYPCPSLADTTSGGVTDEQVQSGCNFPTITAPSSTVCTDARRVTVAVVLDDHGRLNFGPSGPVYVSATFTNPVPTNSSTSSLGLTLGVHIG
jgi:type II secretory pathway pseudopilin PulG